MSTLHEELRGICIDLLSHVAKLERLGKRALQISRGGEELAEIYAMRLTLESLVRECNAISQYFEEGNYLAYRVGACVIAERVEGLLFKRWPESIYGEVRPTLMTLKGISEGICSSKNIGLTPP